MAVAEQLQNNSGNITYEVQTTIYKWLGEHFDIMQNITTYNAQILTPFTIGKSHYLAVANNRDDRGETQIYSEIFKYDLDMDKFVSHQRILTKAARDIKFFCFLVENVKESFLIVANYFDQGKVMILLKSWKFLFYLLFYYVLLDAQSGATSIVYKYVDDYFIPFQSFDVNSLTQWLPVVVSNFIIITLYLLIDSYF